MTFLKVSVGRAEAVLVLASSAARPPTWPRTARTPTKLRGGSMELIATTMGLRGEEAETRR